MLDLAKLTAFCAVVWTMWIAIPIAAALIGTVLALWVLYFFMQVVQEDLDDGQPGSNQNFNNQANTAHRQNSTISGHDEEST